MTVIDQVIHSLKNHPEDWELIDCGFREEFRNETTKIRISESVHFITVPRRGRFQVPGSHNRWRLKRAVRRWLLRPLEDVDQDDRNEEE